MRAQVSRRRAVQARAPALKARAAAGEEDTPSQGIATGLPSLAKGASWATLVHRPVTKTRLARTLAAPAAGAALRAEHVG